MKELKEEDHNTVPKGTASSLESFNATFLKIALSTAKHNFIFLWARCSRSLSEREFEKDEDECLKSRGYLDL